MKFDLTILQDYINRELLEVQSHPTLPLKIYNYSRTCTFNRVWDDITLNMRGTILDNDGKLVAMGFKKFFNLEEIINQPQQVEGTPSRCNLQEKGIVKIPYGEDVYIETKMDGSLGILFNYQDQWIMSSKGSFISEQAIKGREILNKYNLNCLPKNNYYIFEIIYPANRIVVNYGDVEELVLLGIVDAVKFTELEPEAKKLWSQLIGCRFANSFIAGKVRDENGLRELAKRWRLEDDKNSEGYIFHFWPSNFRCKVKFAEYCRLHSLVTQCSNLDIWRALKENKEFNLENVPDEFDEFVRRTTIQLKKEFNKYLIEPFYWFGRLLKIDVFTTQKEKAVWINENVPKKYKSVVFNLLNGTDYSKYVWREIRPTFEKPFWNKPIEE